MKLANSMGKGLSNHEQAASLAIPSLSVGKNTIHGNGHLTEGGAPYNIDCIT